MSSELAKKKRIRGAHKASATKLMQQIADAVAIETDTPNHTKLSCLRQSLNEKLTTIKALDTKITDLLDDENTVVEDIDHFKEKIFSSLLLDKLMESLKTLSPISTTPSHSRVKLPKLQLHPFSGDLTQWTPFWNLSIQQFIQTTSCLT